MLGSSHSVLPFLLLVIPYVQFVDGFCDVGQLKMNGACFTFGPNSKSWDEARRICDDNNMDLARIDSKEKNDAITEYISRRFMPNQIFWTDLRKYSNQFKHTSNKELMEQDLSLWNNNEPSKDDGEDCVGKLMHGLDDIHCGWKAMVVCEASVCPSQCPEDDPEPVKSVNVTDCKDGSKRLGETCYFFETSAILTYDDAKAECANKSGQLARLTAEEKYKIVDEYLISQPFVSWRFYWAAGKRKEERSEEWNDVSQPRWAEGEPNNHNHQEDCIHMKYWPDKRQFLWNDVYCQQHYHYICELNECPADCRPDSEANAGTNSDTDTDSNADTEAVADTDAGRGMGTGPNIGGGTDTDSGTGVGAETGMGDGTETATDTTDIPLINWADLTTVEGIAPDATTTSESGNADAGSDNDDATRTTDPDSSAGQAIQAMVPVTCVMVVLTVARQIYC